MSTIYLGEKVHYRYEQTFSNIEQQEKTPQRIGKIWARLISSLEYRSNPEEIKSLLSRLCVSRLDTDAHDLLIPMVKKVCGENVTITPSSHEDETGVYFVKADGEPVAVFKAGELRARKDIFAHHFAYLLGLGKRAVPGMFCSIANPVFPTLKGKKDSCDFALELYSGLDKTHELHDPRKTYTEMVQEENFGLSYPPTLTGIIEPFLKPDKELTVEDLAELTFLALCLGLTDAKEIINGVTFDNAECMPDHLIPSGNLDDATPTTAIMWLDKHELANKEIPTETLQQLLNRISGNKFNIFGFFAQLLNEKVMYIDSASESMKENESGWDDGGCYVNVISNQRKLQPARSVDDPLLSEAQLSACKDRIFGLRKYLTDCIQNKQNPTCREMALAVDPFCQQFTNLLKRSGSRASRDLFTAVSTNTPRSLGLSLDQESQEAIRKEVASRSPSPDTDDYQIQYFNFTPDGIRPRTVSTPVSMGSEDELMLYFNSRKPSQDEEQKG